MRVLGVEVGQELLERWRGWLAPPAQPFFLTGDEARSCGFAEGDLRGREMRDELLDTFAVWRVARGLRVAWVDEAAFLARPRSVRTTLVRAQVAHRRRLVPAVRGWAGSLDPGVLRGQADGHRFLWWPPVLEQLGDEALGTIVAGFERLLPSRHGEVPRAVWRAAAGLLPAAEELAGTFADRSGPNCFGTVMAAAGVPGAVGEWMLREPFEAWLSDRARRVGDGGGDQRPGTVLVWRDSDGLAQHAAVTLGGGWALHKPSSSWATPRKVLSVGEVLRVSRSAGLRLHRYAVG